jgi:hypothetical protein
MTERHIEDKKKYPVEFLYVNENGDYQILPHVDLWIREERRQADERLREVVATVEGLMEKLAEIEHTRWSKWQDYFFSKCEMHNLEDGYITMRLQADLYERWRRQIETDYKDLSETEKESDRREVRSYLPLITSTIAAKHNIDITPNTPQV